MNGIPSCMLIFIFLTLNYCDKKNVYLKYLCNLVANILMELLLSQNTTIIINKTDGTNYHLDTTSYIKWKKNVLDIDSKCITFGCKRKSEHLRSQYCRKHKHEAEFGHKKKIHCGKLVGTKSTRRHVCQKGFCKKHVFESEIYCNKHYLETKQKVDIITISDDEDYD